MMLPCKPKKKDKKTTLPWKQRSKASRSALSEGLNTSLPGLRYPIICSDSHRWKSPDDFSHGLLISEFKHHGSYQNKQNTKEEKNSVLLL